MIVIILFLFCVIASYLVTYILFLYFSDNENTFLEGPVKPLVTDDGIRYWILVVSDSEKPVESSRFVSLEQAYEFYKSYGKKAGFVVKLGGQSKPKNGEEAKLKYFYCTRESFKNNSNVKEVKEAVEKECMDSKKNQVTEKKTRRKRASCRVGCKGQLRLRLLPGDEYEVYKFIEAHNHPLVHDADKKFLSSSSDLGYLKQLFLYQVSNENFGPVRCFKLMKEICDGFDKVGATSVDCKNFKRDIQLFIGDRDAEMVVEKLIQNQHYLPNFSVDYLTGNCLVYFY